MMPTQHGHLTMGDTAYHTTYLGRPHPEDGEPGPATTAPRQLARETILPHAHMVATAPDGTAKVLKWLGPNKDQLISIRRTEG